MSGFLFRWAFWACWAQNLLEQLVQRMPGSSIFEVTEALWKLPSTWEATPSIWTNVDLPLLDQSATGLWEWKLFATKRKVYIFKIRTVSEDKRIGCVTEVLKQDPLSLLPNLFVLGMACFRLNYVGLLLGWIWRLCALPISLGGMRKRLDLPVSGFLSQAQI